MYVVHQKQNSLKGTYHDVLLFFSRFNGWLRDVFKGPIKDNGYATYILFFKYNVHSSIGISDESSLDECGINERKRPVYGVHVVKIIKTKLETNK